MDRLKRLMGWAKCRVGRHHWLQAYSAVSWLQATRPAAKDCLYPAGRWCVRCECYIDLLTEEQ
jgi:hypothetical protein